MPSEPLVKPLSRIRRQFLLLFLFFIFCILLPVFIFYATGYRYDFFADVPSITATGGIYITAQIEDEGIYVNETLITDARTFRNATYLQGLTAGLHRVHVQSPGVYTWVKELVVLPHIVTEVTSFNLPLVPQVRLVTPYTTAAGQPVVVVTSSTTKPFSFASSTNAFIATTSRSTTTLVTNSEYVRVAALFAEKASTSALRARLLKELADLETGATTSATTTALLSRATTTKVVGDVMIYQSGEDVFVKALGTGREVPGYFCGATTTLASSTALKPTIATSSVEAPVTIEFAPGELGRRCRTDIRIDRKWQMVHDFMFMPDDSDLVLMHLDNGLHVVEVDDRSWQNTQLLYPGERLAVIVDGGRIYASSTDGVVEVFTELQVP